MFVPAMYADKPQGQFGRRARPCTGTLVAEMPNRFEIAGHAFVRPEGQGRSCIS